MTNVLLGKPSVYIGENLGGGLSSTQFADMALERILSVSAETHPVIRAQAYAFRRDIHRVLVGLFQRAAGSERRRLGAILEAAGHVHASEIIMQEDT
jgi:hypothetical protein